jgi:hypothetical protein
VSARSETWAWGNTSAFEWFFVVLGGLPLVLLFTSLMGEEGLTSKQPLDWYLWINAAISSPHVYATLVRLGRKIHAKQVHWLVGWPAYLAFCAVLGVGTYHGYFLELMTAVNVVQSFHYARQGYGVHVFYTRGKTNDRLQRTLVWLAFHLAMPLFVLGRWHILWVVWQGKPSTAIIPVELSMFGLQLCWALAFLGILLAMISEWRRAQRTEGRFDPVGLVTIGTYFAIHVYGFLQVVHFQRGFFAVTIFHAMQYLALVWMLERRGGASIAERLNRWVGRAAFVVFWVGLFSLAYVWEHHLSMVPTRAVPAFASVALGAVSAHHYFADAFIWRGKVGA